MSPDTTSDTGRTGNKFVRGREHPPLPPELAEILRMERIGRGWTLQDAAAATGVAWAFLSNLELRYRCPSTVTAKALIAGYELDGEVADALMACAAPYAGWARKEAEAG